MAVRSLLLLVFITFHVIIATRNPLGQSTIKSKANGIQNQKEHVDKNAHDLEAFKSNIGDHSSGLELYSGSDQDLLGYKADSSSEGEDEDSYSFSNESEGEEEGCDKGSNN